MGEDRLVFYDDIDMDGPGDHGVTDSSMVNSAFADFPLKPEILKAINGIYFYPTEVQNGCLLAAMQGQNILCQAKAGSGKATLSVLATLHQLNETVPAVYVVVLCPTRQLVTKMIDCYNTIAKHMSLVKVNAFGQKAGSLTITTGIHIGVGTPGRVIRAIKNRNVDFLYVKHLVLYEADKMLAMLDMRSDIEEICRQIPQQVQIYMFSEKFSTEVRPICKRFLQQPIKVFIEDEAKCITTNLDQFYIKVSDSEKCDKLIEFLKILHFSLIIVYVKSAAVCDKITNLLKEAKLSVTNYHLGMKVVERNSRITLFKKLKKRILVVAKELEPDVTINSANVVIVYDSPTDVDMYLKYVTPASKSGETKGLTITFLPQDDDLKLIQDLEDWYGATYTELPSKIQLEVTSYTCGA